MDASTAGQLLDINRKFYQQFAASFSATRRRLQPGVARILGSLGEEVHLVDLACGNGELAAALVRRGWRGAYLGLDFSPALLEEAGKALSHFPGSPGRVEFRSLDLANPAALPALVAGVQPVNAVTSFAVLHHLPGEELRRGLLRLVREVLSRSTDPAPAFYHSEWQFLSSPRLAARSLPWENAGISADQVDPGDTLLDWRRDGTGFRYVHAFTEAELTALAEDSGFKILETFYADGENGRLGLYQRWGLDPG